MDGKQVNAALSVGRIGEPGLFPKLEALEQHPFRFGVDFGLNELPAEPGVILIRGARQYGKSTWLQEQIRLTVKRFGPGTCFFLNGDELRNSRDLVEAVRGVVPLFSATATVRRLFIDEITAIDDWQAGLKRLLDAGELRGVLVVTTGSKAADLRHGSERLPGRKGRLDRTAYLFTPVSYAEFKRVCGRTLGSDTLTAYLLSGGSPLACAELAARRRLPDYVIEIVRDWIYGECAASGRSRPALLGVLECIHRFGGTPVGQAKLAREAGLANNTVAAGYADLLMDLLCIAPAYPWDASKRRLNRRRPCKFHFSNTLVAVAWHPARIRSIEDFKALPPEEQAKFAEWLVAQELWRRAAVRGDESPEQLAFWQSGGHELDFLGSPDTAIEVKLGKTSPLEFAWFPRCLPRATLSVVGRDRYSAGAIQGITLEDFLLEQTPAVDSGRASSHAP
jgi:predicted AAA+ superfamily ATPase